MADTYCHSIWIDLGQFEAVKHARSSYFTSGHPGSVFLPLSNVFSDMLGSRADVPSWFVAIESKLVLLLVPVERETEVECIINRFID